MTSLNAAILYIEQKGGKFLSISTCKKGNISWTCQNNHSNSSDPYQIVKRQSWCKQCISMDTQNKVVKELRGDYRLIKYSTSKCEIVCNEGHSFKMTPAHIIAGNSCGICHKESLKRGDNNRLSLGVVKAKLLERGFIYKDNTFKNTSTPQTLECRQGHIFIKQIRHIMHGATGCPECNNYFSSERLFREKIEMIFGRSFPKSRPDWLINPETGYRLELDCFNNDLKLAFEYDGQFHFEVRKGLNNDLLKTQQLDRLKNKLCDINGIKLIRIPYYLKETEVLEIINNELSDRII